MKKRIRLTAFACLLAVLLTGCNSVFDKQYRSEEVYVDEYFEIKDESSVQEVKNYRSMKTALMNLINSAVEYGKIRTEKYKGDPEADISKACFEVTREEPMGIYAVDYITHSMNLIVSYYEIEVYITYRRTPEEIENVVTIRSGIELREMVKEKVENYETYLAVMQLSTDIGENDIKNYISELYRENPLAVLFCPDVRVTAYAASDNTIQEITEIEITYPYSSEKMQEMYLELSDYAGKKVSISNYGDINHVCRTVLESCTPGGESGSGDVYTALLGSGSSNSEGYAMAVKLLCNIAGIESYVVEGRYNDSEHFWNIVNVHGQYCHVDLYADALNDGQPRFMSDEAAGERYSWDKTAYPACESTDTEISKE